MDSSRTNNIHLTAPVCNRAIDIHEGDKVDEAALNPSADGSSALPWRSTSWARASHATGRCVASQSPAARQGSI
jgi:hypothetical protein